MRRRNIRKTNAKPSDTRERKWQGSEGQCLEHLHQREVSVWQKQSRILATLSKIIFTADDHGRTVTDKGKCVCYTLHITNVYVTTWGFYFTIKVQA